MNEENKTEKANKENNDERVSKVADSSETLIEKARKEREALMKENERMEKNIKELREIEASRLLGSSAGNHIESMTTPEQAKEAAAQKMASEITSAFK